MCAVYAGRWLSIDLTSGSITERSITENMTREWLLGSGLAAHLFAEMLDPTLDPLDPASPLLIFNGLLTGTFGPAAARTSWCGRSPLTGIWGDANVGGRWGAELRFAGIDGLIITGRAVSPSYLWIRDGRVEIKNAEHLWGMGTFETHDRLQAETDPKAQVACIGPAGEQYVLLAGIMIGGRDHNRAAARGGMGALMGSKNLKAIVVHGREKPAYADRNTFHATVKASNAAIKEHSEGMSLVGTAGGIPGAESFGGMPLKNWQDGSWPEGAKAISGQTIRQTIWTRDTFCFACPVGCGKAVEVTEGPYAGTKGEGPEYETLVGFGGNLLIDDLPALAAMNSRCNDLGLDTISTSGAIAFATEALERGLIAPESAGKIQLAWGDPEPVLALIDQIARREGLGALLADGVRAAVARLGPEAEPFAIHVKGLELPYHDPRAFTDMGLNYATASRGGCHLESGTYWRGYGLEWPGWQEGPYDRLASDEATVRMVIDFQDFMATHNATGLCKFMVKGGLNPAQTAALMNTALGWHWSGDDLIKTGERIFTLKRLINLRLGVTRADDTLPARLLTEPRPSGGAMGNLPDHEFLLRVYYDLRDWDADGQPTHGKLTELGLT